MKYKYYYVVFEYEGTKQSLGVRVRGNFNPFQLSANIKKLLDTKEGIITFYCETHKSAYHKEVIRVEKEKGATNENS